MRKLFEEYVESADYKISVFFKELTAQINKWFTEGSLGAQGCELDGEIQISNYNPMEKFLIFNFVEPIETTQNEGDSSFRYRVIFMIRLDQMKGDEAQAQQAQPPAQGAPVETPTEGKKLEINKVLLKIHQFDEENKERAELVEEVKVEDIKEDFMIDKIGQLKDKSDNEGVDQNDLKDDIHEQ
jgi:hypothetical protein